jgi:hypothetical protein
MGAMAEHSFDTREVGGDGLGATKPAVGFVVVDVTLGLAVSLGGTDDAVEDHDHSVA